MPSGLVLCTAFGNISLKFCVPASVRITLKSEYAGPPHLFSLSPRAHAVVENLGTEDHYFRIPGLFQGFPGPMPFPGLSRPRNLNILISGLSRTFQCTNPEQSN